ncbi:MAG: NUDIX domain-containing protein [Oenococcus sp.]|uniref:NUDIX hydrolase n=1 Tax=Oenococcus sp. TaxID=1979414 RepID=UPI0039E97342
MRVRKSIECWLYESKFNKFLLLHIRNPKDDFWQPITGGIEAGETGVQAAIREIKEETTINVQQESFTFIGKQYVPIDDGLAIDKQLFFCRANNKDTSTQVSDEHVGYKWVDPKNAASWLTWPNNKESLIKALALI